jgi:CHAT domain-containing protein
VRGGAPRRPAGRARGAPVTLSVLLLVACAAPAGTGDVGTRAFGDEIADLQEALRRGQGGAALAYHETRARALDPARTPLDAARAHAAVAYLAWRQGRLQTAMRAGRQGQDALRAAPPTEETVWRRASLASILAVAHRQAGDLDGARQQLDEGLAAAAALRALEHALFWTAHFTRSRGDLALARDLPAEAAALAREAAALIERQLVGLPDGPEGREARESLELGLAAARSLLGTAYRRLGRLDEAEAELAAAREIVRARGVVETLASVEAGLGWIALDAGRAERARERFGRARPRAEALGLAPLLVSVHAGLARSHARLGQPEPALAAYRRALAVVEDLRGGLQEVGLRSGFLDDKQSLYHGAVQAALDLGQAAEAFHLSERSRARAFLDLLGAQSGLARSRVRALVDEEGRLRVAVAEGEAAVQVAPPADRARVVAELDAARRAYRDFLERIRRERVEDASLLTVEPATLDEVRSLLGASTSLVHYLVTDGETVALVADAGRTVALRLPVRRAELVAEIRAFREAIAAPAPVPALEARARRLYRTLVAPLRPHLARPALLVVPHDVLHYLPFAALQDEAGRWLSETWTLASLPSASVLRFLRDKDAAEGGALAVGNPDVGPGLALRWAEREAQEVAGLRAGATVLLRGAATKARVTALAGTVGLLHFAAHAELDEREPMRSALLLTPAGGDDGRLEVREVLALELRAGLAVLSACETGLGTLSRGDELIGLQRAFLHAGARAVVTTLWKVGDAASFALMRQFYARLPELGPAGALRHAQAAVRVTHPHPFAWAGYAFVGDPGDLSSATGSPPRPARR